MAQRRTPGSLFSPDAHTTRARGFVDGHDGADSGHASLASSKRGSPGPPHMSGLATSARATPSHTRQASLPRHTPSPSLHARSPSTHTPTAQAQPTGRRVPTSQRIHGAHDYTGRPGHRARDQLLDQDSDSGGSDTLRHHHDTDRDLESDIDEATQPSIRSSLGAPSSHSLKRHEHLAPGGRAAQGGGRRRASHVPSSHQPYSEAEEDQGIGGSGAAFGPAAAYELSAGRHGSLGHLTDDDDGEAAGFAVKSAASSWHAASPSRAIVGPRDAHGAAAWGRSPAGASTRSGHSQAAALPPAQMEQIEAEVDSFLLSLPLGTGPEAAEVEARVAERLVAAEAEVAVMQGRVAQWSDVAMELYGMVSEHRRAVEASPRRAEGLRASPGAALSAIRTALSAMASQHPALPGPATTAAAAAAGAGAAAGAAPSSYGRTTTGALRGVVPGGSGGTGVGAAPGWPAASPGGRSAAQPSPRETPTAHHANAVPPTAGVSGLQGPAALAWAGPGGGGGIGAGAVRYDGGGGGGTPGQQGVSRAWGVGQLPHGAGGRGSEEMRLLQQELQQLRAELALAHSQRQQGPYPSPPPPLGAALAPRGPAGHVSVDERELAAAVMMQAALVPQQHRQQPHEAAAQQQQQAALVAALRAELEVARVQLAEKAAQASAAADEAGRLRRALLDAEIEGQQATVAGEAARKQLQQAEEQVAALTASNGRLAAELEVERGRAAAVVTAVSGKAEEAVSVRQQLQSELQLARAEAAARAVEAGDLGARLAARTAELAVARQQAAALQAAAAEAQVLALVREERDAAAARAEGLQRELAAARQQLTSAQPELVAAQEKLVHTQQDMMLAQRELAELGGQVARLQVDVGVQQQGRQGAEQALAAVQEELRVEQQRCREAQEALGAAMQQLQEQQQQQGGVQQQVRELDERVVQREEALRAAVESREGLEAEVRELRGRVVELCAQLEEREGQLEVERRRLDEQMEEQGRVAQDVKALAEELASARITAEDARGALAALEGELREAQRRAVEAQEQKADAEAAVVKQRAVAEQLQREVEGLRLGRHEQAMPHEGAREQEQHQQRTPKRVGLEALAARMAGSPWRLGRRRARSLGAAAAAALGSPGPGRGGRGGGEGGRVSVQSSPTAAAGAGALSTPSAEAAALRAQLARSGDQVIWLSQKMLALEEAARERDATYGPLVGALQQERQLLREQLQAAEAEAEAADRRAAAATAAAARAAAARAAEVEAQASRVAAERDAVLLSEQQGRLALMGQVSALQMGVAELQAANRRLREQVDAQRAHSPGASPAASSPAVETQRGLAGHVHSVAHREAQSPGGSLQRLQGPDHRVLQVDGRTYWEGAGSARQTEADRRLQGSLMQHTSGITGSTGADVVDQRSVEAAPGEGATERWPAESIQSNDADVTAPANQGGRADLDHYGREWLAAAAGVLGQVATSPMGDAAAGPALLHVSAGTDIHLPTTVAHGLRLPQSVTGTVVHVDGARQGGRGAGSRRVEGSEGGARVSALEPFGSVTPLPQLLPPRSLHELQRAEGTGHGGGTAGAGKQVGGKDCSGADGGGPIRAGQLDPNRQHHVAVEAVGTDGDEEVDGQWQGVGEHQEAAPQCQQQQGQPQPPPVRAEDGVGEEDHDGVQQHGVQEALLLGGNEKRGEGADGWVEVARVQLPPPQQQEYEKVEGRRFGSAPGPVGGSGMHDLIALSPALRKAGSLDGEAAAVAASAGPGPGAADLVSELLVGNGGEGDNGRPGGRGEEHRQEQRRQRDVGEASEEAWEAAAEQHVPEGHTGGQDHHVASLGTGGRGAAHRVQHHGGTLFPVELLPAEYGEEEHGGQRAADVGSISRADDEAEMYGNALYDRAVGAAASVGHADAADSASSSGAGSEWEPLGGAHIGQGALWEDTDFGVGHVRGGAQGHAPSHAFSHSEHEAMLASVVATMDQGSGAGVAMDGLDRDGHHGGGGSTGVAERLGQLPSAARQSLRAFTESAETEEADIADLREQLGQLEVLLQHGRRSGEQHLALAPMLPRQPLNPQRPLGSTTRAGQAPQLLPSTYAPHPTASPSISTQYLNAATAGGHRSNTTSGPATPTTTPGHTPTPTPAYTPTPTPLPSRAPSFRASAAYRASAPSSRATSFRRTPSGLGLSSSSAAGGQAPIVAPTEAAPMTTAATLSLPPQQLQQQRSQAMEAAAHALAEVEARLPLAPPRPQPHPASHPHPPHTVRLLPYSSFSPSTAVPPPAGLPAAAPTAARPPLAAAARSPLGATASPAYRRSEPGLRATLLRTSSSGHGGAGAGAGPAAAVTAPGAAGADGARQLRHPPVESGAPGAGVTARAVARSVFGARRASTPASLSRGVSEVRAQTQPGQDGVASPLLAQQPAGTPGTGSKRASRDVVRTQRDMRNLKAQLDQLLARVATPPPGLAGRAAAKANSSGSLRGSSAAAGRVGLSAVGAAVEQSPAEGLPNAPSTRARVSPTLSAAAAAALRYSSSDSGSDSGRSSNGGGSGRRSARSKDGAGGHDAGGGAGEEGTEGAAAQWHPGATPLAELRSGRDGLGAAVLGSGSGAGPARRSLAVKSASTNSNVYGSGGGTAIGSGSSSTQEAPAIGSGSRAFSFPRPRREPPGGAAGREQDTHMPIHSEYEQEQQQQQQQWAWSVAAAAERAVAEVDAELAGAAVEGWQEMELRESDGEQGGAGAAAGSGAGAGAGAGAADAVVRQIEKVLSGGTRALEDM